MRKTTLIVISTIVLVSLAGCQIGLELTKLASSLLTGLPLAELLAKLLGGAA